jgi:hypothetical protein
MLVYRNLPEAQQQYMYLCNILKNTIKERKLDKQTALEQTQMDKQKIQGPKTQDKHQDGSANAAEAKAKGKGKTKKNADGTPSGKARGRSSEPKDAKALAAAAGDDDGWKEVRSQSAIKRAKKKEKLAKAFAAESGKGVGANKGAGKDGAPRPKTRLCYYYQTTAGCNKSAEDCSYLHKKGSRKEIEEMEAGKSKGKAARAGSPAPGVKKKGGKGAKNDALAANATAETSDTCPLGDACMDSACWRTKIHNNSAYVARDGPLFGDEYLPMPPDLEASEQ